MKQEFSIINGLENLMQIVGRDTNNFDDCAFCVGVMNIPKPEKIIDAFIAASLIKSKGEFRKNPTSLWIDSNKVDAFSEWTFEGAVVLTCGKNRIGCRVVNWSAVQDGGLS